MSVEIDRPSEHARTDRQDSRTPDEHRSSSSCQQWKQIDHAGQHDDRPRWFSRKQTTRNLSAGMWLASGVPFASTVDWTRLPASERPLCRLDSDFVDALVYSGKASLRSRSVGQVPTEPSVKASSSARSQLLVSLSLNRLRGRLEQPAGGSHALVQYRPPLGAKVRRGRTSPPRSGHSAVDACCRLGKNIR